MALIDVLNFTNKIGEMNIFIVCFAILVVIYIGSTQQLRTDVWNIAFLSLAVCILAHEIGNYVISLFHCKECFENEKNDNSYICFDIKSWLFPC